LFVPLRLLSIIQLQHCCTQCRQT